MSGRDRPAGDSDYEPRYDVLLTAIPAVFAASYLLIAGHVAGRSIALLGASLASGLLILGALFFDPPTDAAG